VTADHQYYNAKAVADVGGAVIVRDNSETAEKVMTLVKELDADRDEIRRMEKASLSVAPVNATDIIYKTVMETYR
jgi:UDP-N-acetylglucosamine--N-acetylmuramyl-(pentapeptide) pyrophosphoryl-undecaprenol N-acetylglucosamine transferase